MQVHKYKLKQKEKPPAILVKPLKIEKNDVKTETVILQTQNIKRENQLASSLLPNF